MRSGRLLSLVLALLSSASSHQHPPPFSLNGLVFNISTRVAEGAEVCLHCEYFLRPQPKYGFTMIISFLEEASLTRAEVAAAASTQFRFPGNLREAHKKSGRVVNKTIYTPSMRGAKSIFVSKKFFMSSKHAGSYICQMIPVNATSTEGWTLTKWIRLELYHDTVSLKYVWPIFAFGGLPICLFLIWYCACRPQRMIFKRVLIEKSLLHFAGAPMSSKGHHLAKVTLVPEPRPSLRVYMNALYQRRGLDHFSEVDEICEVAKKEKEEAKLRVRFLMPSDPTYEVPFGRVQVEGRIGEGAFGLVLRGSAMHLPGGIIGPLPVAIKTLRVNSSDADVVAFVQEIEMMKFIGKHENVIQLYATSNHNGRPVMIMEYAAEGSLVDYLRKNRSWLATQARPMTELVLLCFARQIANGMVYLASKDIVHRDLAARNVVLTKNLVAKIADFGLTRKVEFYYRMKGNGRVPLKWMAPESVFQKVFTSKSDIWSFGVLLWELFSLGDSPAANLSVNEFLEALHLGPSLYTKPKYADEEVFSGLMQPCWEHQPECRPTFTDILATLSKFLQGC
ncbi:fibroblast growth factor receptor 4 [Echinococcus multilocularis]|uniref:Fibroblast growth factor receptor 4 n=1 Tax=Echinococcus multilocularis TaxID=6211 RepID=A0A068Y870_ECHMU|nr:fibroblast growth factor receptor 4 [Echinococcus multilocularis]